MMNTTEEAFEILFVLLDVHIMQSLLSEGYTHAVLKEFIPADEAHRAKVIFYLLPRNSPLPEKATPLTAHCFTEGLQKAEKDFYFIFASGAVLPQAEAPCLSGGPAEMMPGTAS